MLKTTADSSANAVKDQLRRLQRERAEAAQHAGPEADEVPRPDEEGGDNRKSANELRLVQF
jgi:DNA-directed RNA polymerase specialized sigma24 family protein